MYREPFISPIMTLGTGPLGVGVGRKKAVAADEARRAGLVLDPAALYS